MKGSHRAADIRVISASMSCCRLRRWDRRNSSFQDGWPAPFAAGSLIPIIAGLSVAEKNQESSATGLAARFSKRHSEVAIGIALVLAAGGFTLAQFEIDVPFQWCPTGTVDRVECFRGWLLPLAGWIAALFAYLTIRQIRKQLESLEDEIEKGSAAERKSSLRLFKNEMFNFHSLESQMFQDLTQAIAAYDEHGSLPANVFDACKSAVAQVNAYDWSRLRALDDMAKVNAQIDLLRTMLEKIRNSADDEKQFVENARHYVFVREIFYAMMAEETDISFDTA